MIIKSSGITIMANKNDLMFIQQNMPKLPVEANRKILLQYMNILDKHEARIEKTGCGNYLYLEKIPVEIVKDIKMHIEFYLNKSKK